MSPRLAALAFDAYGTLFDVHSVVEACEQLWPGKGAQISQLWRAKQLEYTWQRSLMGRYVGFEEVTAEGLRYACASLGCAFDTARLETLMKAYLHLKPFPEVPDALAALKGIPLAILSNGTPAMLEPLIETSGLARWIVDVISVDAVKIYKPTPRVYQLAADRFDCERSEIGFVSANCWDALGAKSFGFEVFWVNRNGAPVDGLGVTPDHTIASLAELPGLVVG